MCPKNIYLVNAFKQIQLRHQLAQVSSGSDRWSLSHRVPGGHSAFLSGPGKNGRGRQGCSCTECSREHRLRERRPGSTARSE